MKITIIGGGSTYTPELIDGFSRLRSELPIDDIWLVDPLTERADVIAAVARRMLARTHHPARVHTTSDAVTGITGADVVLVQLRVGGQAARHGDESWPHQACCLGQETTGPGGLAKALRTVPVVLELAELVREHAHPDAWIIDFTNPVGIVTRALLQEGHRAVGLCNVAIGFQRRFAALLGVPHETVSLDHVGLNHLTWERAISVASDAGPHDVLPDLLTSQLDTLAEMTHLPASLIGLQQAVPSYYLRYFYCADEVLREQIGRPTRAQDVMALEASLMTKYADPSVSSKPIELESRGGAYYSDAAVQVMSSLISDKGDVQVLNVINGDTLPFLPPDHVIEVPARVSAAAIEPEPVAPVPEDMAALMSHVAHYERLALDAAIHGGRSRVLKAMLANPLVGQIDRAERLTDLLLAENKSVLRWLR